MRLFLTFIVCSSPALAWEFTPGLPCTLTSETETAQIELTYDPTVPLYTVTVRQTDQLPEGPIFAMRFDGPAGLSISTDRHVLSNDKRAVTVQDRGFGNVLNGLQFNNTATALIGDTEIPFPLDGAEEPVAAFRTCKPQPGV